MPVSADRYRASAARLPGGVGVLAVVWRGSMHATTVSSVTSLSLDPPLLGVGVHVDSRVRDALDDVATWSLSVLGDTQGPVADWFAQPGRPVIGQLDRVGWRPAPGSAAAWIDGAAAWFDLRTVAVHPCGDHDLVVGEVVDVQEGLPGVGGLVHLRGRLVGLA